VDVVAARQCYGMGMNTVACKAELSRKMLLEKARRRELCRCRLVVLPSSLLSLFCRCRCCVFFYFRCCFWWLLLDLCLWCGNMP
jgi:hypothetical protein